MYYFPAITYLKVYGSGHVASTKHGKSIVIPDTRWPVIGDPLSWQANPTGNTYYECNVVMPCISIS
jgi:hypothetical protein